MYDEAAINLEHILILAGIFAGVNIFVLCLAAAIRWLTQHKNRMSKPVTVDGTTVNLFAFHGYSILKAYVYGLSFGLGAPTVFVFGLSLLNGCTSTSHSSSSVDHQMVVVGCAVCLSALLWFVIEQIRRWLSLTVALDEEQTDYDGGDIVMNGLRVLACALGVIAGVDLFGLVICTVATVAT
jgi:hypothetical protein